VPDRPIRPDGEDAARWAAIFDAVVQAVVTIDDHGVIGSVNPAGLEMFGYAADELVGGKVNQLMTSLDADQHDSYIANHLRTGEKKIIGVGRNVTAKRKDGTTFPVHLTVGKYTSGGQTGFVGLVQDLSALREAEERLAEREQILRATLDDAPLASAQLQADGTVVSANRSFWQLTGRSPDDTDLKLLDCFLGENSIDDWIRRGAADAKLQTESGQTRYVQVHLQRLTLPSRAAFLLVQIEDQTEGVRHAEESKIHRERLERMDRISLAGEMASGIAHEVNQPLSAIANYSRALLHMFDVENIESEDIRNTVEKIRSQSHRAGEIVRRMRDFVSKHSTDPRPSSINATVHEVLSFAELSSRGRKVKVDLDLAAGLPRVLFDRVQLQQVILNLVNNAVEASHVDEQIRIGVRSFVEGPSVMLHVVDHGSGIDEVTETRLFEPFFSSKRHGTGMGLAISRSIVESQGGTIGFLRNPDGGVTFYVQLPALRSMEGDHE
jgi:two-component system sensor kinase FixL